MKLIPVLFLISVFSASLAAQGTIFDMDPAKPFHHGSFAFSHPYLSRIDEINSSFSGTYNLNMNFLLSDSYILHFGIPYNYVKYDYGFTEESTSGTGNVRVGLQNISEDTGNSFSAVQFFLYLPTSDKDAAVMGLYSDFTDWVLHYPDIFAVMIQYASQTLLQEGFAVSYYVGGHVLFPTEKEIFKDPELFFRFAIEPQITISQVNFFVTFKTVAIITAESEDFGDRFQSMFGLGASLNLGNYYPRLSYRFYLDDEISDFIGGVLILGLDFNIGE